MKKIILVAIAIASLSTITPADARIAKHRTIHHHAVMGAGMSPVVLNANASLNGDGVGTDHTMHMRNLHDSGYNPKKDFDSYGSVSVAQ